jgi:cyclic-di-GMP-binding biofilm dispersal mediator protein
MPHARGAWDGEVVTSLSGARVLVAGATGGLGAPTVRLMADRGARLTLVSRSLPRLEALAVAGARLVVADLRDPGGPASAVAAAVDAFGGLDGVVYAAGVVAFGPAVETDDETLVELFETNFLAPVRMLRAAAAHLQGSAAQGRSPFVLALSAVVAEQPVAGMAAYAASKAALTAFDAAAARELRRARIRLVDVRPPHTETGLAHRPVAGSPPALPPGLRPEQVAERIVRAVEADERDLPSGSFG